MDWKDKEPVIRSGNVGTLKGRGMKPRYSGPASRAFWDQVNALKRGSDVMYALGCVLQNTEEYVLSQLRNYEASSVHVKPKGGTP